MDNTQRSEDQQYLHVYKIVLLGDQGVGKTHLLNRYIKRQVPKNLTPTIGVEFANATVELREGG
jgi:GTPase SAR1 family protein